MNGLGWSTWLSEGIQAGSSINSNSFGKRIAGTRQIQYKVTTLQLAPKP
jgi:hypothetical protein